MIRVISIIILTIIYETNGSTYSRNSGTKSSISSNINNGYTNRNRESVHKFNGHSGGVIPAAIQSRYNIQTRIVDLPREPITPAVVLVEARVIPLTIVFRSASSSLNVMQQHIPGFVPQEQYTKSEDEPHRLIHEVTKPIIQEVKEVISPFRKIVQEIQPVQQDVQTIIARNEHNSDNHINDYYNKQNPNFDIPLERSQPTKTKGYDSFGAKNDLSSHSKTHKIDRSGKMSTKIKPELNKLNNSLKSLATKPSKHNSFSDNNLAKKEFENKEKSYERNSFNDETYFNTNTTEIPDINLELTTNDKSVDTSSEDPFLDYEDHDQFSTTTTEPTTIRSAINRQISGSEDRNKLKTTTKPLASPAERLRTLQREG